jgi:hypothetical protein
VLGIQATISESTAWQWLKFRLGYECKEAKKGIYIDGHEHPDMIKESVMSGLDVSLNQRVKYGFVCGTCSGVPSYKV